MRPGYSSTETAAAFLLYLHGCCRLTGEERPEVQEHLVDVGQHKPQQPDGILLPYQVVVVPPTVLLIITLHTFTSAFIYFYIKGFSSYWARKGLMIYFFYYAGN